MKRALLLLFCLSLFAATAFAGNATLPDGTEFPMWEKPLHFSKTYYVDCQAKNADDNGPGTKEHPFRTINHAAQVLQPGERVVIAEGVYREFDSPGARRHRRRRDDQLRSRSRRKGRREGRGAWSRIGSPARAGTSASTR